MPFNAAHDAPDASPAPARVEPGSAERPIDPSSSEQTAKIALLEAQVALLQRRVRTLSESVRFRLGSEIVAGVSSPKAALGAPRAIASVLRDAWRLARWRGAFMRLEIGQPNDPFRDLDHRRITRWDEFDRLSAQIKARAPVHVYDALLAAGSDPTVLDLARRARELTLAVDQGTQAWVVRLGRGEASGSEVPGPDAPDARLSAAGSDRRIVLALHACLATETNGYALRSHALARALIAQGWDVRPYVRSLGHDVENFVRDGVCYRALPAFEPADASLRAYVEAYGGALAKAAAADEAGLIHAASNYITGLAGALAAAALARPFVYELRGFWEETRASVHKGFAGSFAYELQRRLETEAARRAHVVVTLNAAMADELKGRGVARAMVVAPNAAETATLQMLSTADARAQFGLTTGPVIGFVGSLTPYEGLETAIDALAILARDHPGVRLLIVGDGPAKGALEAHAARNGLNDRVVFAGRVPPEAARAAYAAIDVAPFPRLDTSVARLVTPLKPFEAIAAGVPIAVSEVRPLLELSDNGRLAEVFKPGDARALAAALAKIFNDAPAAKQRAVALRAWAQERFTWERAASLLGEAYRRAASAAAVAKAEAGGPAAVGADAPSGSGA